MFDWLSQDPKTTPLRIVVKIGTQVISNAEGGFDPVRLEQLVMVTSQWQQAGHQVLMVTSGAVGLGKTTLGLTGAISLEEKQACAAVGQSYLMQAYQQAFMQHGITTAQVLLTAYDLANRSRYLNLQKTLEKLLGLGIVPVINENDCVSVAELLETGQAKSFGDNDMLSALVASKLDANLLVLLTNVNGVYDKNPLKYPDAQRVDLIETFDQLKQVQIEGQSDLGRGGMTTKLRAAQLAAYSGVTSVITSGFEPDNLIDLAQAATLKEVNATVVMPQKRLSSKKRWVGFASGYQGVLVINECAHKILLEKNNVSLLSVGVVNVLGEFSSGDVVSVQTEQEEEIGRGVVNFSAQDVQLIQGLHTSEIATKLGRSVQQDEVIHKDNLVIFNEALL